MLTYIEVTFCEFVLGSPENIPGTRDSFCVEKDAMWGEQVSKKYFNLLDRAVPKSAVSREVITIQHLILQEMSFFF